MNQTREPESVDSVIVYLPFLYLFSIMNGLA